MTHCDVNCDVCGVRPAFLHILPQATSQHGRLTDSESEEQQEDKVVSNTIDCQLTSQVHYTDRPEPQHDDLHSSDGLITTYESLTASSGYRTKKTWANTLVFRAVFLRKYSLNDEEQEERKLNVKLMLNVTLYNMRHACSALRC
ncbi:unnamed protein product [Pleuronectes platessa]|uniref:Uncharacterized protein n=1 Tax=Pleuronectes platessa TaxID=8262 RepID=A0A9N7Z6J4_PLEPL|nr:unnamed protein product [Pleuronectes platessa]